jgi:hypothetical protein
MIESLSRPGIYHFLAFLDLCSMAFVHRSTSPNWIRCLRSHLAAVASDDPGKAGELGDRGAELGKEGNARVKNGTARRIYKEVGRLKVGETLLSAPIAAVDLDAEGGGDLRLQKLGTGLLMIRVRSMLMADREKNVMAS